MGNFTPKAGSIASVAVIDEQFDGYQWVFGKHEISEAFGANASDYWIHYRSQVTQFEEIRDTSFQSVENSLNRDRTRLEKKLREGIAAWIIVFQECDEIIVYCENIGSHETYSHKSAQAHVIAPAESPSTGDSNPQPLIASNTGQNRESHFVLPGAPNPSFSRRMRKKISSRWKSATQGVRKPRIRHRTTRGEGLEAEITTTSIPVGQNHELPTASERWREKRERFIELLESLEEQNGRFSGKIISTQPNSIAAELLEAQQVDSELSRHRSGGDRLQILLKYLRDKPQQSDLAYQLLLQSDPFDFRSKLCGSSSTYQTHSQDGDAAFYLRLSVDNIRSETADDASPSSMTSITDGKQGFFIFNVAEESGEVQPNTEISDLALLFEPRITNPVTSDWATFYGHFERKIRIISDSTPHSKERSFVECVTDPDGEMLLGDTAYAGMRAELAFVVASSMFYKLYAEGLYDVEATRMHYYTPLNARRQEYDYVGSRILPYISLDTIGSTAALPSSADALIRSTRDDLEERMMKTLGILIYEIGAWKRVAVTGLQERVMIVEDEKEHLREDMRTKYRNVIHSCLSYRHREDRERWMIQNVILPLKKVCEEIQGQPLRR